MRARTECRRPVALPPVGRVGPRCFRRLEERPDGGARGRRSDDVRVPGAGGNDRPDCSTRGRSWCGARVRIPGRNMLLSTEEAKSPSGKRAGTPSGSSSAAGQLMGPLLREVREDGRGILEGSVAQVEGYRLFLENRALLPAGDRSGVCGPAWRSRAQTFLSSAKGGRPTEGQRAERSERCPREPGRNRSGTG